jgi:hypothetical protein
MILHDFERILIEGIFNIENPFVTTVLHIFYMQKKETG